MLIFESPVSISAIKLKATLPFRKRQLRAESNLDSGNPLVAEAHVLHVDVLMKTKVTTPCASHLHETPLGSQIL